MPDIENGVAVSFHERVFIEKGRNAFPYINLFTFV